MKSVYHAGLVPIVASIVFLAGCGEAPPAAESAAKEAPSEVTIDEAVAKGNLEAVKGILSANPGAASKGSRPTMPPLIHAVTRKRTEIAMLLIEAGADVNAVDSSQRTALHLCVERDLPDLVGPLMKAGAKPDERDSTGWTPLHHAGAKDRVAVAKALIGGGANINAVSVRGGTGLHEAAASGSAEIVQLFLENGVDASIVASDGVTALDVAKKFANEAAIKLLSDSK